MDQLSVEFDVGPITKDTVTYYGDLSTSALLDGMPSSNLASVTRFVEAWAHLAADSPICFTSKERRHSVHRLFKRIREVGLKTYVNFCSKALHDLLKSGRGGLIAPTYCDTMASTHLSVEYHLWRSKGSVPGTRLHRFMIDSLNYGKRIRVEDPALEATAMCSWLETEVRLRDHCDDTWYLSLVRTCIAALLTLADGEEWPNELVLPKHGSGSTADVGKPIDRKVAAQLKRVNKTAYAFFKRERSQDHGWVVTPKVMARITGEESWNWHDDVNDNKVGLKSAEPTTAEAQEKHVPKSLKTLRSICMEDSSTMMWQQAVLEWLVRLLEVTNVNKYVRLNDQDNSRRLALEASLHRASCTVDLSSASDSIRWTLIKEVFPEWIVTKLAATRSRYVKRLDGDVFEVVKAGPMGNAWTFPVQCILFTGMAVASLYLRANVHTISEGEVPAISDILLFLRVIPGSDKTSGDVGFQPLSVYGDDIIIDQVAMPDLFDILEGLGFVVNRQKSFYYQDSVRESCGMFAWDGVDISPIRYSMPVVDTPEIGAGELSAHINMANDAFGRGYLHLRGYHIRQAKKASKPVQIPKPRLGDYVCPEIDGLVEKWLGGYYPDGMSRRKFTAVLPFTTDHTDSTSIHTSSVHSGAINNSNSIVVPEHQRRYYLKLASVPRPDKSPSGDAALTWRFLMWSRFARDRRSEILEVTTFGEWLLNEAIAPQRRGYGDTRLVGILTPI